MPKFYSGSTMLLPIADALHLQLDQINFVFCQLFACFIGYMFNKYMSSEKVKPQYRHMVEITVGISMTLFCFGSQIWYLLAQSVPAFILIKILPIGYARYLVLVFALFFLSVAHIARMYYDYGSYTLDITGPLMIQTQRLSSLPFNISDGEKIKKNIKLRKESHKSHAVLRPVSVMEFLSYLFNFHGLMVGPFVFFADYIRFIEGTEETVLEDSEHAEYFVKHKSEILLAKNEIKFHFMSLVFFIILHKCLEPMFRPENFLGSYYQNSNFFMRYLQMTLIMFFFRQKYYLAWTTCALTNLFSGLGFSGFNKNKQPMYNVVKNFHFMKVEFGTSTKVILDHWNVGTSLWLRECVYDRMPRGIGTLAVSACSAIWHGYYSGYYLTFASVALMTNAARTGRKYLRPIMLRYQLMRYYDILTAVCSMFCLNFSVIPFALLDLTKGIRVWWSLYLTMPIICTTVIICGMVKDKLQPIRSNTDDVGSRMHSE